MCEMMARAVAMKDMADPMKVGIATTRFGAAWAMMAGVGDREACSSSIALLIPFSPTR